MKRVLITCCALLMSLPAAGSATVFDKPTDLVLTGAVKAINFGKTTDQVIGGVRAEFDQLRAGATRATNQAATGAGAFGGARQGVLEGTRLGQLDRAQGQVVGGLLSDQFNQAVSQGLSFSEYQRALRERQSREPIFRNQLSQGFLQGGLGPTGSVTEQVQPGNLFGDIAGAGLALGGSLLEPGSALAAGGGPAGSQFGGFTAPQFLPPDRTNPLFRR